MKNPRVSITYHGRNLQGFALFFGRLSARGESLGFYRCAGYSLKDARAMARKHFQNEAARV